MYYPVATFEYGLKYALMPGIDLSMRKIRSHKKELEFNFHFTGSRYPYEGSRGEPGQYHTDGLVKSTFYGASIGRRKYHFFGSGFAPVGFYTRWALRYEAANTTIPEGTIVGNPQSENVGAQSYGSHSAGLLFGLGKEFPIRDKWFMGFYTNFGVVIPFAETEIVDRYSRLIGESKQINVARNSIIVSYSVSYLL